MKRLVVTCKNTAVNSFTSAKHWLVKSFYRVCCAGGAVAQIFSYSCRNRQGYTLGPNWFCHAGSVVMRGRMTVDHILSTESVNQSQLFEWLLFAAE